MAYAAGENYMFKFYLHLPIEVQIGLDKYILRDYYCRPRC